MSKIDEYTLSCYLDGKLDYQQTCDVARNLEEDPEIRDTAVQLLETHVLLKSLGNEVIEEAVPEEMLKPIKRHISPDGRRKITFLKTFLQIAVAIALIFAGYKSGQMNDGSSVELMTAFPDIPIELEDTVNRVLEYEKSGTTHNWMDNSGVLSATVTPIKTLPRQ